MRKGGLAKFLGGLAVGAGLGILFAPDKGENTRKILAKKLEELVKKAKEIDVEEVKDQILYKVQELQAQLSDLDKEKVKEIAVKKANQIKEKAEELYKYAIEKGTPVVEKATDDVRRQALKVVKDLEASLNKKESKK
jgi:gas vesicle protein